MHFYQYVQSQTALHQHVPPTAVTVINLSYTENQVQHQAAFIVHFCTVICTMIVHRDEGLACHRNMFLKTNKCDWKCICRFTVQV